MLSRDAYGASRCCDKAPLVFGDGHIIQGEGKAVLNRDNMGASYGLPALPAAGGGRLFPPLEAAR